MKKLAIVFLTFMTAVTTEAQWYINLSRVDFPLSAQRCEPFAMTFSIENDGSADINRVEITYTPLGGTEMSVTHRFESPVAPGTQSTFEATGFTCDIAGEEIYGSFSLTAVNGERNYGSGTYLYLFCADELIARRLVIEEGASVSCGYCPRGYVAMEYMRETATDGSWIGISIQETGAMADPVTFRSFWNRVASRPIAFANRDYSNSISPLPAIFENQLQTTGKQAAVCGVEAAVSRASNSDTYTVTSDIRFVFDYEEADFRVAYIITEDNLGPYPQRNYYAGGSIGEFYGWENKPSYVDIVFNDIARPGSIYDGISGLLPAAVNAGQVYSISKDLDLSGINSTANAKIAVLVIDGTTGRIANAVQVPVTETQSIRSLEADVTAGKVSGGIGLIVIDASDSTVYNVYDICGRLTATGLGATSLTATPGIYIVRCGGRIHRIAVR